MSSKLTTDSRYKHLLGRISELYVAGQLRAHQAVNLIITEAIVSNWYRQILKAEMPGLIATWAPRLGVEVNRFYVQQMKTQWGSCNSVARTLRLNTELAKKPKACLEYIVVHEMCHLLQAMHGAKFLALMDRFMPGWRETRAQLNSLPARHERWTC